MRSVPFAGELLLEGSQDKFLIRTDCLRLGVLFGFLKLASVCIGLAPGGNVQRGQALVSVAEPPPSHAHGNPAPVWVCKYPLHGPGRRLEGQLCLGD